MDRQRYFSPLLTSIIPMFKLSTLHHGPFTYPNPLMHSTQAQHLHTDPQTNQPINPLRLALQPTSHPNVFYSYMTSFGASWIFLRSASFLVPLSFLALKHIRHHPHYHHHHSHPPTCRYFSSRQKNFLYSRRIKSSQIVRSDYWVIMRV